MKARFLKLFLIVSLMLVVLAVGVTLFRRGVFAPEKQVRQGGDARIVPVEVSPVTRGRMERRRVFSGTLTPSAELSVAPKIAGRIARILVDLSDPVARGAEVALLDDAEYRQSVASAQADLAVAKALASESETRIALAKRELERVQTLEERGVASASALDSARTEFIMRQSAADVAVANVLASEAALATAEIRLGYTRVTAAWSEGDAARVVAERLADEGDTVAANTPLLSVVSLRPIRTVFHVSERDYALLRPGQAVELRTDAFPGEIFPGIVTRVAPVFREDSRQARVEVVSENTDERLKPGMFVRASVVLEDVADVRILPLSSITRRGGGEGVFLVDDAGATVRWVPVKTGLRNVTHAAIMEPELEGRVVSLGLQFLSDGASVRVIDTGRTPPP